MYRLEDDWIYQQYIKETYKQKLLPTDFYYNSEGQLVFTESYNKKRGSCCNKDCKHCSFKKS